VPASILSQFRRNLVLHESDLPGSKGWSALTWQILEGNNRISVTLFEVAEKVDSGVIYAQEWLEF
jgi:methionyl-tRNA formyltransferase